MTDTNDEEDDAPVVQAAPANQSVASIAGQQALIAGAKRAATFLRAFAPEIILGLLLLLSVIATLVSLYLILCTDQACNGTAPIIASQPFSNKQDSLELKTAVCLDKAAKTDTTGDGPLPKECLEPIKGWSQLTITTTTTLRRNVPNPDSDEGKKAIQLLDDILAAAKEANGVTAATTVKTAQAQRKKLEDTLAAAKTNAIINKLSNISAHAQVIIDYVKNQGPAVCKQSTGTNCGDTADGIVRANFADISQSDFFALGGLVDGPPTDKNIQDVQEQLAKGNIPIWQVRGNGKNPTSGKHFIVVLGIDANKNITYFDPASGSIETNPYNYQSTAGWGDYFGTPTLDRIGGNKHIRGYYWIIRAK